MASETIPAPYKELEKVTDQLVARWDSGVSPDHDDVTALRRARRQVKKWSVENRPKKRARKPAKKN